MSDPKETASPLENKIDVNSSEFYELLDDEIENDMAKLKKNLEIMRKLRLSAAEMEVETAALFHAELWYNIEELNIEVRKNAQDQLQAIPQLPHSQMDMSDNPNAD